MKKVLIVIAPKNFKDKEFYEPYNILKKAGLKITIASLENKAISVNGQEEKVDILIKEARTDYEAIILIGGPGAVVYINNLILHKLINKFNKEEKIIAAICIAPAILAKAGVLKNKKATIYPGKKDLLENLNIEYIKKSVVIDKNIITADGPASAKKFGKAIIKSLF